MYDIYDLYTAGTLPQNKPKKYIYLQALITLISPLMLLSTEESFEGVTYHADQAVIESTESIMARSLRSTGNVFEHVKQVPKLLAQHTLKQVLKSAFAEAAVANCATLPNCRNGAAAFLAASSAPDKSKLKPNFTAITFAQALFNPPDPQGAVGPTQYIALSNGRIRSFSKSSGLPDGVLNATLNSFFASVAQIGQGYFTADPNIRFDRHSRRWFVTAINFPNKIPNPNANKLLIAVSNTATISSATRWSFFSFRGDATALLDAPSLGIDAQALYVGANMFAQNSNGSLSYRSTFAYVIPKARLLTGGPVRFTKFTVASNTKRGPLTPIGVDNFNPNIKAGFFIGVDNSSQTNLILLRVLNPATTPTISGNIFVPVPQYIRTLLVPHKGNTGGRQGFLDSVGLRLSMSHIRGNRLYTSHTVGVNNKGISAPSTTLSRNGCRWYEINLATPTAPKLVQMGTLFAPTATNDLNQRHYFIPAIMTNSVKSIVIACTTAGAQAFIDAAFALRYASDPLGTLRQPVRYTATTFAYNPSFDPGGPEGRRWGDYSGIAVDPSDDMTIWATQQYCNAPNSWGMRAVRIPASPPPAVTQMVPNSVLSASAPQSVNFIALSDSGAAFSPASRRVLVDLGPCVKVVKSRVVDPNLLQADVVTRCARRGSYNITVTNPDGQESFAPGVFVVS